MGTEAGAAAGDGTPDARRSADPLAVAGAFGVRALGRARLAAVPAGIALGLLSASVDWELAVLNSLFAVVWIVITNRAMSRHGLDGRATRVIATVDVAIVTIGLTVTGGVNSDMRMLLGVLPLASAFEFRAPVVAGVGLGGASVMTALSLQDPTELSVNLVVLAWSTLVGLALARDRRALLEQIDGIARTRSRLLAAHEGAAARERARAGEELRLGALEEVRAARLALAAPGGATAAAALCRSAAAAVRGLVSELHALSAQPIVLRAAVQALADRRAQAGDRVVTTAVDGGVDDVRDDVLLVLVRDLLDAAGEHAPDADVTVVLRREGGAATLTVTVAADGAPFEAETLAIAGERLAAIPGARLTTGPDQAVVRFGAPDRTTTRHPPTIRTLLTARVLGGTAVLALAALGGVTAATFWVPAAIGLALVLLTTALLRSHPLPPRGQVAGSLVDAALVLVALGLAGPAQDELLLLVIGFLPVYACVFGPVTALGVVVALGAGSLALTGFDLSFAIAFAWAAVVTVVLADAAQRARRLIAALLARRRVALLTLLDAEESARRSVARRLHDDALQFLLAARQDVEEAAAGGPGVEAAVRRAAVSLHEVELLLGSASLREEVDRRPEAGLGPALAELAGDAERDGGLRVRSAVDAEVVDRADEGLVLGLAREFVTNVILHAGAAELDLTVDATPARGVRLVVADDGIGIPDGREQAALDGGHIGLAAARDRVRRRGGSLTISAGASGGGTTVTVVLPPRA